MANFPEGVHLFRLAIFGVFILKNGFRMRVLSKMAICRRWPSVVGWTSSAILVIFAGSAQVQPPSNRVLAGLIPKESLARRAVRQDMRKPMLRVQDNGCGIPMLGQVCEPFYRL